jgi:hypothetical protein
MTDAIIEAAAKALTNATEWSSFWGENDARQLVQAILPVIAPVIEAAALEKAAKVAEKYKLAEDFTATEIAAAIRALK